MHSLGSKGLGSDRQAPRGQRRGAKNAAEPNQTRNGRSSANQEPGWRTRAGDLARRELRTRSAGKATPSGATRLASSGPMPARAHMGALPFGLGNSRSPDRSRRGQSRGRRAPHRRLIDAAPAVRPVGPGRHAPGHDDLLDNRSRLGSRRRASFHPTGCSSVEHPRAHRLLGSRTARSVPTAATGSTSPGFRLRPA